MGDLKAGDLVYSENGVPVRVTVAHPVDRKPVSYRLLFDDGSSMDACADHLWLTFTQKELQTIKKRTPEYRAARQASRLSRSLGNKSPAFVAAITARNKRLKNEIKEPSKGTVRTTLEIIQTLKVKQAPDRCGGANHAIPVTKPLQGDDIALPLDPYLLGVWLGDGTSIFGNVTTADDEIIRSIRKLGFTVDKIPSSQYGWSVKGLITVLRKMGLKDNKHVPAIYLRASFEQRLALLQGLMDTDGYAGLRGAVEFTSTNLRLAEAVHELVVSLGIKARIGKGRAVLNGIDCGPKYRLTWTSTLPMFRLKRKLCRQNRTKTRQTTRYRYIIAARKIPSRPMRCITVDNPTGLFLAGRQMIPTHNSFALIMAPLAHIDVSGFGCVIFRRTFPQITNEGGLWDESSNLYPHLGARPTQNDLTWRFPSGAAVSFAHMQNEADIENWKGAQVPLIGLDQIEQFSEKQFWGLLGSNRSTCGVLPYIRATCNPDPDSWVAHFISWWIDQDTGYPIAKRSGKIRWFVRIEGELVWHDNKKELIKAFPKSKPKSLTFIAAKVFDNKILLEKDEGYLATLEALPAVDRERYLMGNWKIRLAAGMMFPRDRWKYVDKLPEEKMKVCRFWDKAGTAGGKGARTAGVALGVTDPGTLNQRWYIIHAKVGRWADKEREDIIKETAQKDVDRFDDYIVGVEQEPGTGGQDSAQATIRNLSGFRVFKERATGEKQSRWKEFACQQQAGNVYVVRSNDWDWHEYIMELDGLAGDKELDKSKLKDLADASSGAFNKLSVRPAMHRGPVVYDVNHVTQSHELDELLDTIPERDRSHHERLEHLRELASQLDGD